MTFKPKNGRPKLQLQHLESINSYDPQASVRVDTEAPSAPPTWRFLVVGPTGTGKRSVINAWVFDGKGTRPSTATGGKVRTLAHTAKTKMEEDDEQVDVSIEVISAVGRVEEPDRLPDECFERIHAVMIVFSTDDKQSFLSLPYWYTCVKEQLRREDVPFVFVENKIDLIENTALDTNEVDTCARRYGFRLYRASPHVQFNIGAAFQYLVDRAVDKFPDPSMILEDADDDDVDLEGSGNPIIMPSKRRTAGVKPPLNRHTIYNKANEIDKRCTVM